MSKGVSVADLERMMGRKADNVSPYRFDPMTGGFVRNVTFKLGEPKRKSIKPKGRK